MQTRCHLSVLVHEQARKYGGRRALTFREFGEGAWRSVTWEGFSETVTLVSRALLALGVAPQENVGIFSQNAARYIYTDFGILGVRAVSVPFYATSSEQQVQHMVDDARIRLLFVGGQEQYDKARRIFLHCPTLERMVIYDPRVRVAPDDPDSLGFEDFLALGRDPVLQGELERRYGQANEEDLCNILYTSGTTGQSKGVMLTYGQFHAALRANDEVIPVREDDRVVDFLPFSHILERGWIVLCLSEGAEVAVNTDPKDILEAMRQVRPTCMCAVPRFWEKLHASVMAHVERAGPTWVRLFRRALAIGHSHNVEYLGRGRRPPGWLSVEYRMVDGSVFSLIRKGIGLDRPNVFPTAGAAIAPEIEGFVHSIGIWMVTGYGLTESLATVSCNRKGEPFTVGSVGYPIRGLDVRIGEGDEILLKGPTVTRGYYRRDDLNGEAFDAEGYFHTGDAGFLQGGELFLKERIKDLFKTSNGKYIAPQVIEAKLLVDKYIDNIAVVADNRKFVSALVIPDYGLLEEYARRNRIGFASREELCANEAIHAMLAERIDTLQQQLASYERIKRFAVLPHGLSMEDGEVTTTLKLRRKVLEERYAAVIDAMYDEG